MNVYAVIKILGGGVCLAAVAVVLIKLILKLNNKLREEEANSVAFKKKKKITNLKSAYLTTNIKIR